MSSRVCRARPRLHNATLSDSLRAKMAMLGQSKEEKISLTRAQIMEGAKKEGKLSVSPPFELSSIPIIVKAFEKKYPFIKVSSTSADGIPAYQRQLFELSAGRANLDIFSTNIAFWSEYFKQNVVKKVDFNGMAQKGQRQ